MSEQYPDNNQSTGINPEQLPSLEPTAQVPPVHSDKLNDPQYWNDKFQEKSAKVPLEHRDDKKSGMAKKVIASIAGVAVLGGGAFAGVKMLGGNGDSHEGQSRPTATAPANPGETKPSQESSPSTPESDSALALYGIEVDQYPTFDAVVNTYYKEYTDYRSSGNVSGEPGDARYLEALYGRNWENSPMATYVNAVIEDSIFTINRLVATANATGEPGDAKYEESTTVTDTSDINVSPDGSKMSGIVTIHYTTNAGDTVFASYADAHDADSYGKFKLEFTNKYGYWKLTSATNLGE